MLTITHFKQKSKVTPFESNFLQESAVDIVLEMSPKSVSICDLKLIFINNGMDSYD